MKIEIICPCCNKKFQVIIPISDIGDIGDIGDDDFKDNKTILEQELFEKHNILLG